MNTQPLIPFARTAYGKWIAVTSALQSTLLLAIRLYWGWQFCQNGWGKLHNLPKITAFFTDLGIPLPGANAVIAGCTECFGGLLLLIGLASRLTVIPLIITMIVAYLTADSDAVKHVFSDPDSFVSAAPFLFLFASLIVLVFGPGKFSVDHLLARRFRTD